MATDNSGDQTLDAPQDTRGDAYAAYDVTLQRFVGGVHRGPKGKAEAGKSDAHRDAKDAGHQVEVRQV
jgi:hypothetical protein